MRELKVVGLDADSKYVICESDDPAEQFKLAADDRLRAVLRDAAQHPEQPQLEIEVTNMLSPKEIQAKIRAARPSSRSPRRRGRTCRGSAALPTRCCWNGSGPRSWQPPPIPCWPTVPPC
ncbi:hypothetical protein I550_0703 [Mycobacterium intracellulare 1956]|uniref:DUF3071 domain-containing protein n=1 Tax=Mycobacterium intracellulare 1956 TaxID=1299331 RepID=X8CQ31_MYCIT|nr:hypothetical protein I550_0703 [Mycobacterium intracellulare 1956]